MERFEDPPFTHPDGSKQVPHSELAPHFRALHAHLINNRDKTDQKRNKRKDKINSNFLVHLGRTQSALGARGFETPHEFRRGKGVYTKRIAVSCHPPWLKRAWDLALPIINKVCPGYAGEGNYIVMQFSRMTSPSHFFKKHTDAHDIDQQYLFTLGPGECDTVIYTRPNGRDEKCRIRYRERVVRMDGRVHHMVDTKDLKAERFAVIFYKMSDPRYKAPAPIMEDPIFVSGPPPDNQNQDMIG